MKKFKTYLTEARYTRLNKDYVKGMTAITDFIEKNVVPKWQKAIEETINKKYPQNKVRVTNGRVTRDGKINITYELTWEKKLDRAEAVDILSGEWFKISPNAKSITIPLS